MPERPPPPEGLRSLGILGGTFNPPHLGHLVARHALSELGLQPRRADAGRDAAAQAGRARSRAEHRLAMCRLLVDGCDGLTVCALETERDGPSYTVDTLTAIHASHPQAELTLIVGADIASTLPAWREPRRLLGLATLAVAARPGSRRRAVLEGLGTLGEDARVDFLHAPTIDVSSSQARERALAGKPIGELVGDAVAGYIAEHGLYGAGVRAAS